MGTIKPQANLGSLGLKQSINFSCIIYHTYTAYLFICNNIKDIILLGFLFGALNASVAPLFAMGPALRFHQILRAAPSMILWSWSNLFLFNLHNQRHSKSIAEDSLNKPWRPLPTGRLTPKQATWVMYCMYPIVMAASLTTGGLVPCLLEAVSCLWYNELGGSSHPFLKNLLNGLGFACFFAGPFEVATEKSVLISDLKAVRWLAILGGAITTTSHLQDFRDVEGDRATGRRTMPLVIGDLPARVACALGIAVWNSVACWFWTVGWRESIVALTVGAAIIRRLLLDRSTGGDTFAWKLFPLWVIGLTLLPVLKVREGSTSQ
ncbi:hypothetical protein F4781DRAFT_424797 [Annulohypoxylon bovei var. microspora]|nr:hypothetical protein F4781DRAFT_424797 [Annulohypoxylon bovei var. microspora]